MKGFYMAHNNFPNKELQAQFMLSYELLILLRWLVDHDEKKLKKVIAKACSIGLEKEFDKMNAMGRLLNNPTDIHDTVVEFFGMLENILTSTIQDRVRVKAHTQNLMPSIDKIDSNECNDEMVQYSLEKATTKSENNPQASPKELLYEELLRRWKPTNQTILN